MVQKNAVQNHSLYDTYPGLKKNPQTISDLRPNNDLNDITKSLKE